MKGYTPPPRLVVSNEPQPITRSITITEGVSVKDLDGFVFDATSASMRDPPKPESARRMMTFVTAMIRPSS